MLFTITGWLSAIYCLWSACTFAGSRKLDPGQRIVGMLTSIALMIWIIRALSILASLP